MITTTGRQPEAHIPVKYTVQSGLRKRAIASNAGFLDNATLVLSLSVQHTPEAGLLLLLVTPWPLEFPVCQL